jgi:hypothetical protein
MAQDSPEQLIHDVAESDGDIALDLRRVLRGFIKRTDGPEAFGEELGNMFLDEEVPVSSRVTLGNSMTKLLGTYGEGVEGDDLATPEQLKKRIELLEREAAACTD